MVAIGVPDYKIDNIEPSFWKKSSEIKKRLICLSLLISNQSHTKMRLILEAQLVYSKTLCRHGLYIM